MIPNELSPSKVVSTPTNMRIVVRLRPLSQKELTAGVKTCCEALDANHVAIKKAGSRDAYLKSQASDFINEFAFDHVFGATAKQDEVYQHTLFPYLPKLLSGQHVTALAYGATGAGKTHTMFGGDIAKFSEGESAASFSSGAGVIPQCLRDLYKLVEEKRRSAVLGEAWSISLSFFEVYNDQVYDLIDPSGKNLPVREDADRGIVLVCGLKELIVHTPEQIFELLVKGQKYRKMEPTMANVVSSRSHAILQVVVKHITRNSHGFEVIVESKLSLIDLAGSERASVTNNRGIRLQEGASINKSLLALANCINSLSENSLVSLSSGSGGNGISQKKSVVKYRDSKLTHILKSSLEGNCNLIMITNVNPCETTYEDSLHTLQYANRAKNIKVNPVAREQVLESTSLERESRLKEENEKLRKSLAEMEAHVVILREENERLHQELEIALEENTTKRRSTFSFGRYSTGRKSASHEDEHRHINNGTTSPRRSSIDRQSSHGNSTSSPGDGSRRSSFGFAAILDVLSPSRASVSVPTALEHSPSHIEIPKTKISTPESDVTSSSLEDQRKDESCHEDDDVNVSVQLDEEHGIVNREALDDTIDKLEGSISSPPSSPSISRVTPTKMELSQIEITSQRSSSVKAQAHTQWRRIVFGWFICGGLNDVAAK
jgi:hypothetical protein